MESKVEIFDISISLLPKSRDLFQGDSILRRCAAKFSTVYKNLQQYNFKKMII